MVGGGSVPSLHEVDRGIRIKAIFSWAKGSRSRGIAVKEELEKYLLPTPTIDSDNPQVTAFALEVTQGARDPVKKAVKAFYAVRDGIWYDPYTPFYKPNHYKASEVLKRKRAFCIPKAVLLCTLGRALGIPSRLCFFDVRNHLATKQLIEFLGGDGRLCLPRGNGVLPRRKVGQGHPGLQQGTLPASQRTSGGI